MIGYSPTYKVGRGISTGQALLGGIAGFGIGLARELSKKDADWSGVPSWLKSALGRDENGKPLRSTPAATTTTPQPVTPPPPGKPTTAGMKPTGANNTDAPVASAAESAPKTEAEGLAAPVEDAVATPVTFSNPTEIPDYGGQPDVEAPETNFDGMTQDQWSQMP